MELEIWSQIINNFGIKTIVLRKRRQNLVNVMRKLDFFHDEFQEPKLINILINVSCGNKLGNQTFVEIFPLF